jgi:maltooligosyltrehalose trehalohydrolase
MRRTVDSNLKPRQRSTGVSPSQASKGSSPKPETRRLPVGAELVPDGVHFRVWAPQSKSAAVELSEKSDLSGNRVYPLQKERGGYFAAHVPGAKAGQFYKYRLASGSYPDPASRFQPLGPHGPSQIIDPDSFSWTDHDWAGVAAAGQIVYEMHVGTFTGEGTWRAAAEQLPELSRLGVTVLELMPLADFPGRFCWGYDGVNLFAPTRLYGTPDDFRQFIDRAHGLKLGVILDVVYNHFGPDGNYLKHFAEAYFTQAYANEWGEAINFDGKNSGPVREFFIANAGYWIDEYHVDGLRLDATQQIFDCSSDSIIAAVTREVRARARGRATFMVAENEPQETRLVRPVDQGGDGMDALWNDDFHHTAMVALTGRAEAYYSDYQGTPQEFISTVKWGYLFQGQRYKWQKKRRGTPTFGLAPWQFINYIQNHDQIANSLRGLRIDQLTSPARLKTLTALLLLAPGTPMLFQGQEFAASQRFLYFADHTPELAKLVTKGRKEFLSQFRTIACPESESVLTAPESEETFQRCKLDFNERQQHKEIYTLHRDLIHLRRTDPVLSRLRPGGVDGAVLGRDAFVLRFFSLNGDDDRLLLVNFGIDLNLNPAPEPLLAPVRGRSWATLWSSEAPSYGGCGTPPLETEENWLLPGQSAVLLKPDTHLLDGENHTQDQCRPSSR